MQDGEEFFCIKISMRSSLFLPCILLQSAGSAPPSSDDNGPGAGRTQQKKMSYPVPYAHIEAGRSTGIREQICEKEVNSMLQCIIRKLIQKILAKKKKNQQTPEDKRYW